MRVARSKSGGKKVKVKVRKREKEGQSGEARSVSLTLSQNEVQSLQQLLQPIPFKPCLPLIRKPGATEKLDGF